MSENIQKVAVSSEDEILETAQSRVTTTSTLPQQKLTVSRASVMSRRKLDGLT